MSSGNRDFDKEKKRKRTIKTDIHDSSDSKKSIGELKKSRLIENSGDSKKIKTEADIQEKVLLFYAEEEEVERRDTHADLVLYKEACGNILKAIQEIKQLKKNKGKDCASLIEDKKAQATLQFVLLKKHNRLAHIRCKKVREATNEAKLQIDKYHLQLQNLLYEAFHLQKEINKCLEFKSKDEEIELVDVEEFYRDAPASISKPEQTRDDPHHLTLARLDWELEQRKELAGQLEKAQEKKEELLKQIKSKREYLDSLQPKLNSILQATKPVQDYLEMPFDEIKSQHQIAYHLPRPLYVLYLQTSAYKEACDSNLTVSLMGDQDAAQSLDLQSFVVEEESDSDQEEQDKSRSKRRRKTNEARISDRKERALQKHPLSVVVTVGCKDKSKLFLTFNYLFILNVITVDVKFHPRSIAVMDSVSGSDLLLPDNILAGLYPGDHGNDTPNPGNQYVLKKLGLGGFSTYIPLVGRPYMWAQTMAGLHFLQPEVVASNALSSSHMQNVIHVLRERVKARLSLLKQLISLERFSVPISSESQDLFPVKILTHVTSWQRSSYEDFEVLPYTQAFIAGGFAQKSDMYFTAVMERASAKLTANIIVAPDYPNTPPLFVLNICWHTERNAVNDCHVQEMENEVNVYYEELMSQDSNDQILANQLQRLMVCFDVYLETEVQNTGREGPVEISKEKIYPRLSRGPNRNKPFKYEKHLGIFNHR